MSRQRLIIGAAALALLAAVAATTGFIGGDDAAPSGAEGAADCRVGQVDGDLELLNWSEYLDPALVDAFEQQNGVTVTEEFFASSEEAAARLAAGETFDIVVPSDYLVPTMVADGLLQPYNSGAIPNLANLLPEFTERSYDPSGSYAVPYQWGTTGLAVNLDAVGGDVDPSWSLVFDPDQAAARSGRITLLETGREVLGAALKYLGYSLNTEDTLQLVQAADAIEAVAPHLHSFNTNDYEDLLLAGEVDIAMGFSGDVLSLLATASAEDPTVLDRYRYFVPTEGGPQWVDNMVIPAGAEHPCTAHAFMNFILDASNGAALSNYTFYASPNAASQASILPEILGNPAVYPPAQTMARLEVVQDLAPITAVVEDRINPLITAAASGS